GAGGSITVGTGAAAGNSNVGGLGGQAGASGSLGAGGSLPFDASCGDGMLNAVAGESCDDGNLNPNDGCGPTCTLDPGFACPNPGAPCVNIENCGDGNVSGNEQCDDANQNSSDGCSDACQVEPGWTCPTAGSRCIAAECGDGLRAGTEQCDDLNSDSADGCSATCQVEHGYFCPTEGQPCQPTVCGNSALEGDEGCDDGNKQPWDGCSPTCEREPSCTDGECQSVCGDGMVLGTDSEECDDSNQNDGDGCDKDCNIEAWWDCTVAPEAPPEELVIPVVYRDFISFPTGGSVRHPNFEDSLPSASTASPGLVLAELGADRKPVYAGICDNADYSDATLCPHSRQLTTKADFDQWYNDTALSVRADSTLTLAQSGAQYVFDGGSKFLPFGVGALSGVGWVALGKELNNSGGDFGFTTEIHYWFELNGDEHLDFAGDDDVWVFFKNELLIDLGGKHASITGSVDLTDAEIANRGLTKGHLYEIAFFHAERHTSASNFKLTLSNFVRAKTACVSTCGDGVAVGSEICDEGELNGSYGHCNQDCSGLGPHCGDGLTQTADGETCDDGGNLTTYGISEKPACAPGCKQSPFCGDGVTDALFGEQCDAAGDPAPSDGCQPNCTYRTFCGDGVVQAQDGETCDDGNTVSGDGCSSFCTVDQVR
ncbi:MAG TPA: DUF4215 domain-containing protein, partial [Polyangiaceae bacterium]|nr:DUF4215 domain-containing protein [Polyangiaceae bacterium]